MYLYPHCTKVLYQTSNHGNDDCNVRNCNAKSRIDAIALLNKVKQFQSPFTMQIISG